MFAGKVKLGNADKGHEPKLAAISTTWHEHRNEVVGTKIAIALVVIRDAYGVAISEAIAPAKVTAVLKPAIAAHSIESSATPEN
jgi:hypothetical protein